MQEAISVTRYNNYIKQIFDAEELLHNINIVGEVFGVSFSRQVAYFSLKDENSAISCVCFYPQVSLSIREGDLVVITGSPNYYQKTGKLSFNVVDVKPAGQGLLYQKFLELKEKLEHEGLFSAEHKKAIPQNIKRIGVITSKEGAVIQDIINIGYRRDPSIDIVLYPCKVQGNGAENEIAYAIEKMDEDANVDVIVVARGGGSLEDLWAYNTEIVARATYNCKKPIVSAVGHETDYTIIDFVSDLRAPTPSAAAELLTSNITDKKTFLSRKIADFNDAIDSYILKQKNNISMLSEDILNCIKIIYLNKTNNLQRNNIQLKNAIEYYINNNTYNLDLINNSLENLSPLNPLKKGYAKIEQDGKVVDTIHAIMLSSDIKIYLADGNVIVTPKEVEERK